MCKSIRNKLIFFIAVISYFVLAKMFSYKIANISAIFVFIVFVVNFIIIKMKIRDYSSRVQNKFVNECISNQFVLTNPYCIVKYFKNEKIIVMDNPKSKNAYMLRAFIVDKTNNEDIKSCWLDICAFFDKYTYLDSLFSFIDKTNGRLNIMFLNSNKRDFTLEGMEEFLSETIDYSAKSQKNISNAKSKQEINEGPLVIDFKKLQENTAKKRLDFSNSENPENVLDIQDLNRGKKIYVNYASSEIIAILPGINIVKAKKIVQYRNINGLFKTKQEFLNVAGAKEHFTDKILDMITLAQYHSEEKEYNKYYDGRKVDF